MRTLSAFWERWPRDATLTVTLWIMTEDPPVTLTALLLRLERFHPRFRAEIATLTRLLKENEITDEIFTDALQVDAVTQRLLSKTSSDS